MARHIGHVIDPFSRLSGDLAYWTPRDRPFGPAQRDTLDVEPCGGPSDALIHSVGNWLNVPSRRIGHMMPSAGDDLLFGRVWVFPQLFDIGFITEDIVDSIYVWNANQDDPVTFNSVDASGEEGTDLSTPVLPYVIGAGVEIDLTLTVYLEGQAVQDTTYTLNVGGEALPVVITGIRVVGLVPEPNWGPTIQINYEYQTARFRTIRFEEQRRPLMDDPLRSLVVDYLVQNETAHNFFFLLSYGHDKVFGVPIYNEVMHATAIPEDGTTITLSTPTASMFNLNNLSTHIAIVDHDAGVSEIKEISSVGANTIEVTQTISNDFNVASTLIYPVFFATVSSLQKYHASDDIETVRIEFKEFNVGA